MKVEVSNKEISFPSEIMTTPLQVMTYEGRMNADRQVNRYMNNTGVQHKKYVLLVSFPPLCFPTSAQKKRSFFLQGGNRSFSSDFPGGRNIDLIGEMERRNLAYLAQHFLESCLKVAFPQDALICLLHTHWATCKVLGKELASPLDHRFMPCSYSQINSYHQEKLYFFISV